MADLNHNINNPAIKHPLRCLLASLRFLTILPGLGASPDDADYFAGALFYFVLTGLLIGTAGALLATLFILFFPPVITAVLLTVFLSLISGFLHLDGLADTADGFMSSRPSELCLEIMRDSRIGVMGAAVISLLFICKIAALSTLSPEDVVIAIIITPVAGRTAIVMSMELLPYVRKKSGLGAPFYSRQTRLAAGFSALFFTLISMVLIPDKIFLAIFSLVLVISAFSWLCRRRIGGATGDTLGAICEISEAVVLIVFTVTL